MYAVNTIITTIVSMHVVHKVSVYDHAYARNGVVVTGRLLTFGADAVRILSLKAQKYVLLRGHFVDRRSRRHSLGCCGLMLFICF